MQRFQNLLFFPQKHILRPLFVEVVMKALEVLALSCRNLKELIVNLQIKLHFFHILCTLLNNVYMCVCVCLSILHLYL